MKRLLIGVFAIALYAQNPGALTITGRNGNDVVIHNWSRKTATAWYVQVYDNKGPSGPSIGFDAANEEPIEGDSRQTDDIPSGASHIFKMDLPADVTPIDFKIAAVIWSDGTYEGDPVLAKSALRMRELAAEKLEQQIKEEKDQKEIERLWRVRARLTRHLEKRSRGRSSSRISSMWLDGGGQEGGGGGVSGGGGPGGDDGGGSCLGGPYHSKLKIDHLPGDRINLGTCTPNLMLGVPGAYEHVSNWTGYAVNSITLRQYYRLNYDNVSVTGACYKDPADLCGCHDLVMCKVRFEGPEYGLESGGPNPRTGEPDIYHWGIVRIVGKLAAPYPAGHKCVDWGARNLAWSIHVLTRCDP